MSERAPLVVEVPTLLSRLHDAGVLPVKEPEAVSEGCDASEPYLKWVGSKRHFVRNHARRLPDTKGVRHVHVPFVGGGSVALYYAAAGVRVTCSDTCEPLITTHRAVQGALGALIDALDAIERRGYSAETYYDVRDSLNVDVGASAVQRAAWFITINKWGFNGLWRTNKNGACNTPFGKPSGKTPPKLYDVEVLRACSMAFKQIVFYVCDFEAHTDLTPFEALRPTERDLRPTFVYFDPPYAPPSDTAGFTAYSEDGFGRADQERLAALLPRLDAAGVKWALSNSDVPLSRELFEAPAIPREWNVTRLSRSGSVSSKANGRGKVGEILVRNYRNPGEK